MAGPVGKQESCQPRTMRTPPDLNLAARLLREPIPPPYRPPPEPRKTWKGLTAGRHLKLKVAWFDGGRRWPAGQTFEVTGPTNAGIQLRPLLTGPDGDATLSPLPPLPWSEPNWKATFETVRRLNKKRGGK